MKLEQDLPTSFDRLYFFEKYAFDFENDTFPLTSVVSSPKTVEKILQNDVYICL